MKTFYLCLLLFQIAFSQNNFYNLEIGTIRYYDECGGYGNHCIPGVTNRGIERVISDTVINEKEYAVIEWQHEITHKWSGSIESEINYIRQENGILYQIMEPSEIIIQNFNINVGDSIASFYDESEWLNDPPEVLMLDTVVTFGNGLNYNILWSDYDSVRNYQDFFDSILISQENWKLPLGSTDYFNPQAPYYFVDSIGVVYSEWNYRKMALVGFENSSGRLYGHKVDFVTNIKNNDFLNTYTLYQNFPNPFNASTIIDFELSKSGKVEIEMYDIKGQRISILINENRTAGMHRIVLDGSRLATGIYVYKMKFNNTIFVRKMLLIK